MRLVFWCSLSAVLYVYVGYPALLALLRGKSRKRVCKGPFEPKVSIIIAAHNEAERIERRLQNCLQLDYPRGKLQIVVALDGPTDGTEFAVWKYARHGVEMVHSKEHRGKPQALNAAIRRASGEVIVFADARQTFERSAIRLLVQNFADPNVGAVSGELMLINPANGEAGKDIGLYWKYEKWIRAMESDIHSVVGATGAIYAIRRDLYQDLPQDALLDDVMTPMRILFGGKRVVFEPGAKAFDTPSCCPRAEFGRKVRTLAGNYQLVARMPELLLPWRNPVFWQFCSHKIGRLVVPYLLLVLLISNAILMGGIYTWLFAGQCAWYACAFVGSMLAGRNVTVPAVPAQQQQRKAA